MSFLCNHGYYFSSCSLCSSAQELVEAFHEDEDEDILRAIYDEYAYDYFLDQDERELREFDKTTKF